jgi:hypothetical protein
MRSESQQMGHRDGESHTVWYSLFALGTDPIHAGLELLPVPRLIKPQSWLAPALDERASTNWPRVQDLGKATVYSERSWG